ncbi:MAG: cadherin repeat domain-containing protein, partial [Balneolaceae bacterium]
MIQTHSIFALYLLITISFLSSPATAQDRWVQEFRNMMEISQVVELESSPAHLYVLSEQEGLVVFRTHVDTLQWLYSSEGMQKRGHTLQADIRFAYLYGDSRRLTIVEPTSVLGVYSSTVLPDTPRSVQRLGNNIYMALGDQGVGRLSLDSPESVDDDPEFIFPSLFENHRVLDLVSDQESTLFVLLDNGSLEVLERTGSGPELQHTQSYDLGLSLTRLFLTESELLVSNQNGEIYYIGPDGSTTPAGTVNEPVDKLRLWHRQPVVRTESGKLWIGRSGNGLTAWKESAEAGNFFTIVDGQLWISENNQLSPVLRIEPKPEESTAEDFEGLVRGTGAPELRPIENVILPF